jgi:UDP-N-acetylglucosamine acyltransferase
MIHPTAVVEPGAKIAPSCSIGPYCIVGSEVEIGSGCDLISHVVMQGKTTIGDNNRFFPFAVIGGEPQDISYAGESTGVAMGDNNVIREAVTINRGTAKGGGTTRIGSHTLVMAYSHIGHDSVLSDHAMLINGATLAGHVLIDEWAVVGALCAVHQFVRVGAHSYIGAGTVITKDVLPFSKCVTPRNTKVYGLNAVGLQRRGFSKERIRKIHHAFHVIFNSKLNITQAMTRLKSEEEQNDDIHLLLRFVEESERGIVRK